MSDTRSITRYAGPNVNQNGFYVLSTPTLFGRGWGRQNVETKLAKIHHKVLILIASRTTSVQILTTTVSTVCLPQPSSGGVGVDKMWKPSWTRYVACSFERRHAGAVAGGRTYCLSNPSSLDRSVPHPRPRPRDRNGETKKGGS